MRCANRLCGPLYILLRVSLLLAATAVSPDVIAADDLRDVEVRATRFWDARVSDDWRTVYDLMPAEEIAVAGDRETFAAYQKERGPLRYSRATVHEVVVEKDLAWVHVEFTSHPRLYPRLAPTAVDTWQVWEKRENWRPVARTLLDRFPARPPKARPAAEERLLSARVDEEWQAQRANEWARIYDLLDPAYRAATPREQFLARRARYRYLTHTVEWVEVIGDRGRVKVAFTRKLDDPTFYKLDPEELVAFEDWRKVDGQWFRDLEPSRARH